MAEAAAVRARAGAGGVAVPKVHDAKGSRLVAVVVLVATVSAAAAAAAAASASTSAEAAPADEVEASKGLTGAAKSLCIPFSQPEMEPGQACFSGCGHAATAWALFGRSY